MKKEVALAVALGIIVGLIVTFGVYTANQALRQRREQTTTTQSPQETAGENQPAGETLRVYSPEDGSIVDKDELQISGATFPGATVTVFINEDLAEVVTADGKGNFSAVLSLSAGSNVLTTIATDPSGKQEKDTRIVVLSIADLGDGTASASARPKATPAGTPQGAR